jgi:hypothetical protein
MRAVSTSAGARKRSEVAIVVGLFLLALTLQLAILTNSTVYMDEGFVLHTAAEINRGKVLYRDIIIPAPGPGAFHLLAWIFRLGGTSFGAARLTSAVMSSAMPVLLYVLARGASSRWAALLVGLAFPAYRIWAFPHWAFFHYATCAAFFVTLAYTLVLAALRRPRPILVALAGAAGGVAFLCKQDIGATSALGLAIAVYLLFGREHRRAAIAALATGAVAAVVPVVCFYAAEGALASLVEQTIRMPLRGAAEFEYLELPGLLPLFHQDPSFREHIGQYIPGLVHALYWDRITQSALYRDTALFDAGLKLAYYLPFALLGMSAVLVGASWLPRSARSTAGARRRAATLQVILAATALAAFSPPRDWIHLLVLSYPCLLLAGWLLDRTTATLGSRARRWALWTATAGVIAALIVTVKLTHDLRCHYDTGVATPAGMVFLTRSDAPVLRDMLGHIAATTSPADPVDVLPYYPAIQFLARRTTAMRSYIFWPVRPHGNTDQHFIDELEASRPPTIIYSVSQFAYLGPFRKNFPDLFAYLVDHYEIIRTFTPREAWGPVFCALRPTGRRAPPLVDLASRLDEATVSVLGPEGRRTLAGPERAGVVGRALWPFRHVVYARPTHRGATVITFRLEMSTRAHLHFAYGLNPDRWVSFTPAAVTFTVKAAVTGGEDQTVFSATVDPQRQPADREWREADIDLTQFSGKEVHLSLHTATDGPAGEDADLAGWAEPRLVGEDHPVRDVPHDGSGPHPL